ncbi:MAG: hypothetical protein C6W57_05655 [Caldibacillus debilis]|nr:MAG: hypothetical protein C6W57_05655 [Caldibacillus debilis]
MGKNVPAVWKSLFAKFSKEDPVRATGMPVERKRPGFYKASLRPGEEADARPQAPPQQLKRDPKFQRTNRLEFYPKK